MKNITLILSLTFMISSCQQGVKNNEDDELSYDDSDSIQKIKIDSTLVKNMDTLSISPIQKEEKENLLPVFKNAFPESVGIWMVPLEKAKLEGPGWMAIPFPSIFKYDGRYITLSILMVNGGTPAYGSPRNELSKDGFYKVRAKWSNDSLFYFLYTKEPPTFLAKFSDRKFLATQTIETTKHVWEYEKIILDSVPEYDKKLILKKRKVTNFKY